jgi:hypothetical protein
MQRLGYSLLISVSFVTQAQLNHHYYFSTHSHGHHLGSDKGKSELSHFFIADDLREQLVKRAEETYRPNPTNSFSMLSVHKFHSITSLESSEISDEGVLGIKPSQIYGYPTQWYKGTNSDDGVVYALLRIIGSILASFLI